MFLKLFLITINIAFIYCIIDKLLDSDPISEEEQDEFINNRLKLYIKRFELIEQSHENITDDSFEDQLFNENVIFKTELKVLKATYKLSLKENSYEERLNLLENFFTFFSDNFAKFLLDELDKQFINEKIRLEKDYLSNMYFDLQFFGLSTEAANIDMELSEAYAEKDLSEKILKYTNITNGLSTKFQSMLDQQPPHRIILNAHLSFLFEFIYSFDEAEMDEYKLGFDHIKKQLDLVYESDDIRDKLELIAIFNDVSTKFGRFLNGKILEYKFNRYGGILTEDI